MWNKHFKVNNGHVKDVHEIYEETDSIKINSNKPFTLCKFHTQKTFFLVTNIKIILKYLLFVIHFLFSHH